MFGSAGKQPIAAILVFHWCAALGALHCGIGSLAAEKGALALESLPHASYRFGGPLGERVRANIDNWLIPVPTANPGMMEMFRSRDRFRQPKLVPWAGEFAGNYLISAIQALRMTGSNELRSVVGRVVNELIGSQAEDGYLGPFPREERFKANWDFRGHHRCMLALLMWHDAANSKLALAACRHAADLVCATLLRSDAQVAEANAAMIHSLSRLHRLTGEPRYSEAIRKIEQDRRISGDDLRNELAGAEFLRNPNPSLESLQGLVELFRITGEPSYRQAFTNHWWNILRKNRRSSGGLSPGNPAAGNPLAPGPIETCGTVAWMALTIDMLQATGDSRAADELELATFNAAAGAQHPSGRWWTGNTPLNGVRESSSRSKGDQAPPGAPELNCCSVNGPRTLGMLSEWAVMKADGGFALNYLGPASFQGKLVNTPVAFELETDYPISGRVEVRVEPLIPRRFRLMLRIPEWSRATTVRVNGTRVRNIVPGRYLTLDRLWQARDRVTILLDTRIRAVPGRNETPDHTSLYRGPLLLAYDQKHNSFEEEGLPPLDMERLGETRTVFKRPADGGGALDPWVLVDVPLIGGRNIRLCDFASAGAHGTRYRSWLRVRNSGAE